MASCNNERPNWIKPNDQFFSMFSEKCMDRMIWLIRTLPATAPTNLDGTPMSILEFFLSMDEEHFCVMIKHCPACTSRVLFEARDRHLERKARQSANMIAQKNDNDLETNMLFV